MPESLNIMLPNTMSPLCFNKDDFMKEDFNVEHFIVECRRQVSLEILRNDLHIYVKFLQSAMIELINKDYADFVNLSTNLVGMDKAINHLISPLIQLKTEITKVRNSINDVLMEIENKMKQKNMIRSKKETLRRMMNIYSSIDLLENLLYLKPNKDNRNSSEINMERVALEFNKLQLNLLGNQTCPLVLSNQQRIEQIESKLQDVVNISFTQSIHEATSLFKEERNTINIEPIAVSLNVFVKESKEDNAILQKLSDSLRTYAIINMREEAERLYRMNVVRPYMNMAILREKNVNITSTLKNIYKNILDFFPLKFGYLKSVTYSNNSSKDGLYVNGYDFIVNSIWPEIVYQIETELSGIFAPGNPDQFHERYLTSMTFVESFENECETQASVKKLRLHPAYNTFMSKWMLPVYFQIRFQEIAGNLEGSLVTPFKRNEEGGELLLNCSQVLCQCLNQCWADNIHLDSLTHRFWKLSLQLLARYHNWLNELTLKLKNQLKRSESNSSLGSLDQQSSVKSLSKSSSTIPLSVSTLFLSTMDGADDFSITDRIYIIADVNNISNILEKIFKKQIETKLLKFENINIQMIQINFKESENALISYMPYLLSSISHEIAASCYSHLKAITDIPRLFRRTNRDVPTRCSAYVNACLKPLDDFLTNHREFISNKDQQTCLHEVVKLTAEQFLITATEVLESVRKMEESLRRLKAARGSNLNQSGATPSLNQSGASSNSLNQLSSLSDDDKIRVQIRIDVEEFKKLSLKFEVDTSSIEAFDKLELLISNNQPNI